MENRRDFIDPSDPEVVDIMRKKKLAKILSYVCYGSVGLMILLIPVFMLLDLLNLLGIVCTIVIVFSTVSIFGADRIRKDALITQRELGIEKTPDEIEAERKEQERIEYLFVSNAAGGVNFDFKVGDLMIIKDHINLLPNPLVGRNMDDFGPRFPDMTRPYDPQLIKKAEIIGAENGIELKTGVYLAGTGPSYETPAEYKYFRLIGADAVGMSTIPEVIVARHMSVPVFGMSVITNEAHDDYADDYENNGDDVVAAADAAADRMTVLFTRLIESLQ